MAKTKTITHGDQIITLSEATNRIGLERLRLLREAQASIDAAPPEESALRTLLCPLTACVVSHTFEHWPLTFDQFLDLPEALTDLWVDAVRELNPHWWGETAPAQSEAEKKVI